MTRSTLTIDCPSCSIRVSAEVIAAVEVREEGMPGPIISLCKCPGCDSALVSEQHFYDYDGHDVNYTAPRRVWPEPQRDTHASVPAIVQVSLSEAHRCFQAAAYTACAVMCGRALEGVCVHFKTPGNMLAKGLTNLRERAIIDERLFEWGEELRKHRNIAAHASETAISKPDALDLLDFVNAIVDYIFVLSARFDSFKSRKAAAGAPPADP